MDEVRFGLRLPTFPVDENRGRAFLNQLTGFLRDLEEDFDSAWISDHFIPWADFQKPDSDTLECWTTLSYLMGQFKKLNFGTIVACNSYRNPALLAKMGATLSVLSGSRFVLGIGAGWMEDEYRAYGYEFPSARTRIDQLEEAVQIIRSMWTREQTSFKGKYYDVEEAYCEPKPDPIPPIMIGGEGERLTLRVVALYADWWNLSTPTTETFRHKLEVLGKHCRDVGRDIGDVKKTQEVHVAIGETPREALDIAARSPFVADKNRNATIIGSPSGVLKKVSEFARLGMEHFMIRFLDFPSTTGAKIFSEEVARNIG